MQAGKGRRLSGHDQDFMKISLVPSSVLSPESLFRWRFPTSTSCIINDAVENSPQIRNSNHLAALGTGPPLGHRPASARSCVPGPEDSPTGPRRTRGSPRSCQPPRAGSWATPTRPPPEQPALVTTSCVDSLHCFCIQVTDIVTWKGQTVMVWSKLRIPD